MKKGTRIPVCTSPSSKQLAPILERDLHESHISTSYVWLSASAYAQRFTRSTVVMLHWWSRGKETKKHNNICYHLFPSVCRSTIYQLSRPRAVMPQTSKSRSRPCGWIVPTYRVTPKASQAPCALCPPVKSAS